jgi:hypothetical protein
MHKTAMFPGFNRCGLSPKPISAAVRQARQIQAIDHLCLSHLELLVGQLLVPIFASITRKLPAMRGKKCRNRTFTPQLTFWAFLAQVLDVDSSCRRALTRVQGLRQASGLSALSEDTAAYCRARARLPIRLLYQIFYTITQAVLRTAHGMTHENRLLVMDGTVITLQDSQANRDAFGYANGQAKGCGFPSMKLLGLFDVETGCCLKVCRAEGNTHDATLAKRMVGYFKRGDILIADRAFCSYEFISKLQAKGVHVIMRLHQARSKKLERENKATRGHPSDTEQTWSKPQAARSSRRKKGTTQAQFKAQRQRARQEHASLPAQLQMRIIKCQVAIRGHRPKDFYLATTLNPSTHSTEQIQALYLRRWEVETIFDDMKTSQNMEMLRTQSPHMVVRELLMHLIVHNLVRLIQAEAQQERRDDVLGKLSYRGTLDRLTLSHSAMWGAASKRAAKLVRAKLIEAVASDVVRARPGRREPRLIKRRAKNYGLLTKPRELMRLRPEFNRSRYKAA